MRAITQGLRKLLKRRKQWTIILHCSSNCWWAHFQELGVDLPLPFTTETKFYVVYDDLKRRYPDAIIVFDKIEIEPKECGCILYDDSTKSQFC